MNLRARVGLRRGKQKSFTSETCTYIIRSNHHVPTSWLDRNLLVYQFASLGEDEVASLGFATFGCTQSNQGPLGIRDEGYVSSFCNSEGTTTKVSERARGRTKTHLGLPFGLSGRGIRTQAINVKVEGRKVGLRKHTLEEACSERKATNLRASAFGTNTTPLPYLTLFVQVQRQSG
jgi:hypothetical protein